jgi:capsular exopolysaccharide synthesis family protein
MTKFTVVEEALADPGPGLVSPKAFAQIIKRRWLPIVLTMAAVLSVVTLAYMMAKPEYVASGRVALDRRTDELVDTTPEQRPVSVDSAAVETEVEVLRSPAIAAAVVDELQLANRPGFGLDEGQWPGSGSRDRAIRVVSGGIDVVREGTSFAISVGYSAEDPLLAARIVNSAIDSYTSGQKTSESVERTREIGLLRDRLGMLRADLIRAEGAVARYRAGTNLIDLTDTGGGGTMQTLDTQLAQASADEAAAAARAAAASSVAAMESPTINNLRNQQAQLTARRAELTQRYGNDYPTLVGVNEQLKVVNQALSEEIGRVRQSTVAEAQVARNRASSLRGSVGRQQGQLMAANNASVQLAELERNAAAAKSLYQGLLDSYKQMVTAQGTERSKAYVIAYATAPSEPSSPNNVAYAIAGIVAALIGAAFVALALESMEAGILNQSMAEKELGMPMLASIPDVATVKDAPLKHGTPRAIGDQLLAHPTGVFCEAFRALRTALKLGQDDQVARSIAITSALPDEGKTTTAICLARSAATAGLRVILVDCDLRQRACSDAFVSQPRFGLLEVLKGHARLEQAIVTDPQSGADILPISSGNDTNFDLITSRSMRSLLSRLRSSYDLVLLETAPALPIAETRAIAAMADATILVVRWRKTPASVVKKAITQLNRAGVNVLGAVLTRVSLRYNAAGLGDDVYYYKSSPAKAA